MSYCTSHMGGWVGKDVPEVLFEGFEDLEQGIERDSSCSSSSSSSSSTSSSCCRGGFNLLVDTLEKGRDLEGVGG